MMGLSVSEDAPPRDAVVASFALEEEAAEQVRSSSGKDIAS